MWWVVLECVDECLENDYSGNMAISDFGAIPAQVHIGDAGTLPAKLAVCLLL